VQSRSWASFGKLLPTRDLVDNAGLHGRTVDDHERDAAYLRAYDTEILTRDQCKAAYDRVATERSDLDQIDAAIEQAKADLEALRNRRCWGTSEAWSR